MKALFSQRRTRFTAAVMLIVWLLALGVGTANACLVQENHIRHGHLTHQDARIESLERSGLDRPVVEHASARAQSDAGSHDIWPGKMACQSFCAGEQTGLAKQKTGGLAHSDFVPVLAAIAWLAPSPAVGASLWPVAAHPAWSEPAVSIRFLRLTI